MNYDNGRKGELEKRAQAWDETQRLRAAQVRRTVGGKMKIMEFKFDHMPDSAQFCTDTAIYSFHEEGFKGEVTSYGEPFGRKLRVI